jgi:hypothetical protein
LHTSGDFLPESFVIERIFTNDQRRKVIVGKRLERPPPALFGISEPKSAVVRIGVQTDDESEDVRERWASVVARAGGVRQGKAEQVRFESSDTHGGFNSWFREFVG